ILTDTANPMLTHFIYTLSLHDALPIYNLFNNLIQRNQSAAFSSGKVRPNHETNINIIARRTGKDVNSVYVGFMVWSNFTATKCRSEERFSRNAETEVVCRLFVE